MGFLSPALRCSSEASSARIPNDISQPGGSEVALLGSRPTTPARTNRMGAAMSPATKATSIFMGHSPSRASIRLAKHAFQLVFDEGLVCRRSAAADEAVQNLLAPGVLEIDLELVALDGRDRAVAELAMEHALSERQVGAPLIAETHGGRASFDD